MTRLSQLLEGAGVQTVPMDEERLYLLTLPAAPDGPSVRSLGASWKQLWVDSGQVPPPLLVLAEGDGKLESLNDELLARVGLQRRPDAGMANPDSTPGSTDEELLGRAVKSALDRSKNKGVAHPRWVAVMDAFALGSSFAHGLCRRFGLDPDEQVVR